MLQAINVFGKHGPTPRPPSISSTGKRRADFTFAVVIWVASYNMCNKLRYVPWGPLLFQKISESNQVHSLQREDVVEVVGRASSVTLDM